jgi:hypothetical protein
LRDEVGHETQFAHVGLTMNTSAKVQMSSIDNTMSIANEKIEGKVLEGHEFAHVKYKTMFHLQWSQGIFNDITRCNSFPTMGIMKKVGPY